MGADRNGKHTLKLLHDRPVTLATFNKGLHYNRAARRQANRKQETNCLRKSLQVNTVTCYQ
jgi:hypothetical protein